MRAVIFGLSGIRLTEAEAAFFRAAQPLGFILFRRNVESPEQLKALVAELRQLTGRPDTPILIDQEGGRVQRLRTPFWQELPPARTYGAMYDAGDKAGAIDGVRAHAKALAQMLSTVGINVDCWPCLDVATPKVSECLGDRLFSNDKQVVSQLANAAINAMLKGGVMPVAKHLPGYGKAEVDPHKSLPVVNASMAELAQDFYPFSQIKKPIWGMTAHVLYKALDDKNVATLSPKVIDFIRTQIGFEGFLITDDISMGALSRYASVAASAVACLKAGCDCVLHCNGDMAEMQSVANELPDLTPTALARLAKAKECLNA